LRDRYKGAARIKGTDLIVTTIGPPSDTEAGAQQESQNIKRQLRSMGVQRTVPHISLIRGRTTIEVRLRAVKRHKGEVYSLMPLHR
jgi:hypothetical protein